MVLVAEFATDPVQMKDAQENGADLQPLPNRTTPIVLFVRPIGFAASDARRLMLIGLDESALAEKKIPPFAHDSAQQLLFAGSRVPMCSWPTANIGDLITRVAMGESL